MNSYLKKQCLYVNSILALALTIACDSTAASDYDPVERDNKKPNVIYILVDDLGYGDVGVFGQKHIRTPSLDQMAAEGMRLTQHYAGSTVCAPSRASLVTGRQPGTVQIRGNYELGGFSDEEEWGQMPLKPGTETIGTMMQAAGYKTALIGKWGLGGPGSYGTPNKQGFDYFFGYLDQKQAHNHYPTHLWKNEDWFALNNDYLDTHKALDAGVDKDDPASYENVKRSDFAQQRLADDALRYVEENKASPFFLYLSFAAPHAALQAPDQEIAAYDDAGFVETPNAGGDSAYTPVFKPKATRAAMITHFDRAIGDLMAQLKKLQLDDNTLVIFSSDNGPSFEGGADLEFFDSNGPFRGYKRDLYEGGIRMPTIAWWPGKIEAGARTDHMSAFWDIMPTLAEVASVDAPNDTDGISMLPSLLGSDDQRSHSHLYWEFHNNNGDHAQAVRFDEGKHQWKAVRRYAEGQRNNPPVELYDLAVDIGERNDLSKRYPKQVANAIELMVSSRTRADIDSWNFDYMP